MFPNQQQNGQPRPPSTSGKKGKIKAKAKAQPKRPPTGMAGVSLYGSRGGGQMPC